MQFGSEEWHVPVETLPVVPMGCPFLYCCDITVRYGLMKLLKKYCIRRNFLELELERIIFMVRAYPKNRECELKIGVVERMEAISYFNPIFVIKETQNVISKFEHAET